MLNRILEPEVMDTREEAIDYDSMDHAAVNRVFVGDFLEFVESSGLNFQKHEMQQTFQILDVGTGTAQIPIELVSRTDGCNIVAIDLASEMLKVGRQNVIRAEAADRIDLQAVDAKNMPFPSNHFDAVISNSIIHHIPDPSRAMAEMLRVLKPQGVLFVRDLLRPEDRVTVDELVNTYTGNENAHQQKMFRESLCAALTLAETKKLLEEFQVSSEYVKQTTDRHWTIAGVL
jgi:ubiquinone/menaquinone biosynthesis C-methylase UbiE